MCGPRCGVANAETNVAKAEVLLETIDASIIEIFKYGLNVVVVKQYFASPLTWKTGRRKEINPNNDFRCCNELRCLEQARNWTSSLILRQTDLAQPRLFPLPKSEESDGKNLTTDITDAHR